MIPTKAKNVLLLPLIDGGITQLFNMPNHAGYNKSKATHNGLDIGWTAGHQYTNILACQDGVVVDVFNNNASMGNGVVLQHDYVDGTHRWTGYIHLRDKVTLKKGDEVKQGDVIGIRGGSPYINGKAKYGVHLHLYVTKAVTIKYEWAKAKENVVNPLPFLYRSKKLTYNKLVKTEYGDISTLPFLEDVIPEVVAPVERDIKKNQLSEATDHLRVRMAPSLQGTVIGYLEKDAFYDWYDEQTADGYDWYKIADEQWVAKTSTMTIYPKQDEIALLNTKIAELIVANEDLARQLTDAQERAETLNEIKETLESKIAQIVNICAD